MPPTPVQANVVDILFVEGKRNNKAPITAEARLYFAMLFHGMTILNIPRTIIAKIKNMANRTIELSTQTENAATTGWCKVYVVRI